VAVLAVFGGHQNGTAPLATDGKALHQAAENQQQWSGESDRFMGGQEADGKCCHAHQEQADDQHLLAADPVPKVAEDYAAQRARDEADGVSAERQEYAGGRFVTRKEQGAEDERRCRPVEKEVVPFDRSTYQAGEDHLTD